MVCDCLYVAIVETTDTEAKLLRRVLLKNVEDSAVGD